MNKARKTFHLCPISQVNEQLLKTIEKYQKIRNQVKLIVLLIMQVVFIYLRKGKIVQMDNTQMQEESHGFLKMCNQVLLSRDLQTFKTCEF